LKVTKKALIISISLTLALIATLETTDTSSAQSSTSINLKRLSDTNDTIPFGKITNVRTHWSYEHPEQIQFNFTVPNEPLLITYSLDNQANIVVSGNFTLTNLSYGRHNVTLYVTDNDGNTVYNTYTARLPEEGKFPTLDSNLIIIPISAIIALIVSVSILLYRMHRKTASSKQ